MFKTCIISSLLLIGFIAPAFASSDPLIHFNLALGGYQIGMPLDDATLIRPFAIVEPDYVDQKGELVTKGLVDQVYLNGIEFRFIVEFTNDQVRRVIGHFAPADIEKVRNTFFETLGESEANTRVITAGDGVEFLLYHDRWQFPDTTLDLIGTENNSSFATLALSAIGQQERIRRDELRQTAEAAGTGE